MKSSVNKQLMKKCDGTKNRLYGLDIFRILMTLMVFLFHAWMHLDIEFGIFESFIKMGAVFMTGFFMLSGFSLFYVHSELEINNYKAVCKFWVNRVISLIPVYYATAILFIVLRDRSNILKEIILFPAETLGIQSWYSNLFNESHNGGTWFISCIMFCYFLFPLLAMIVRNMSLKAKIVVSCIIVAILLYSPFITAYFDLESIYSNPIMRCLEFTIGMILCSVWNNRNEKNTIYKILRNPFILIIEFALLVISITIAIRRGIAPGNYMIYSWIALPLFIIMIYGLASADYINENKFVNYLSAISYAFFLAQFFTWSVINKVAKIINFDNKIWFKLPSTLILCVLISILMYEFVQKPAKKLISKICENKELI